MRVREAREENFSSQLISFVLGVFVANSTSARYQRFGLYRYHHHNGKCEHLVQLIFEQRCFFDRVQKRLDSNGLFPLRVCQQRGQGITCRVAETTRRYR